MLKLFRRKDEKKLQNILNFGNFQHIQIKLENLG